MKNILLVFIAIAFSTQVFGQGEEADTNSEKHNNYAPPDSPPIFPGCEGYESYEEQVNCFNQGVSKLISRNFQYPEMARQMGLSDTVLVSFVIEKNGETSNVKVVQGEYYDLNDEAIRLTKLLPKMEPAMTDGKPVRMQYTYPIKFILQ